MPTCNGWTHCSLCLTNVYISSMSNFSFLFCFVWGAHTDWMFLVKNNVTQWYNFFSINWPTNQKRIKKKKKTHTKILSILIAGPPTRCLIISWSNMDSQMRFIWMCWWLSTEKGNCVCFHCVCLILFLFIRFDLYTPPKETENRKQKTLLHTNPLAFTFVSINKMCEYCVWWCR